MSHEFEPLSGRFIEAAIEVHKELGPGFLESIYERTIRVALSRREAPFEYQRRICIRFQGELVGRHRLDLLVANEIIVELKAIKALEDIHFAQVKSYLKASGLHVGLLMNFQATTLIVKRVVL